MDKKKKINYFADYKLKFISQLFLSNRRMHCALLLYILCCNVITYRIWGIFYFSTGGPCTSICHLSILLWLCCGLWSHTQWPLLWSTVTYVATSFFLDIHIAFLGFCCLVWFGFLPWQTWMVLCECPCIRSCEVCWKDASLIGDLPLPKCVFISNLESCS